MLEFQEKKNSPASMPHDAFSRLPVTQTQTPRCPGLSHPPAVHDHWFSPRPSAGRPLVLMSAIFPGGFILVSLVYANPTALVTSGTCWGDFLCFRCWLRLLLGTTVPMMGTWLPGSCVWHILLHFWLRCLSFLLFFWQPFTYLFLYLSMGQITDSNIIKES